MSQQELADKLGVTQANVSDYERGRYVANATTIVHLAEMFGVSTDVLLGVESVKRETDPLDPAVLKRLRRIKDLSRRNRVAVLRTLDAFLKSSQSG